MASSPSHPPHRPTRTAKNVLGSDLVPCGMDPVTGFYRDGCCNTGPQDRGLHLICCVVSDEFLRHQAEIGNDLITAHPQWMFPGLKAGDKWCVCITRWKESLEAKRACPVVLEATHMSALEFVSIEDLRKHEYAAK